MYFSHKATWKFKWIHVEHILAKKKKNTEAKKWQKEDVTER